MTPIRLEPAALRSRVKHSTTEPLRSLIRAFAARTHIGYIVVPKRTKNGGSEFDFDIYRICLVIMCNYTHVYLEACVRYCMLIWWDIFFFVRASVYMHCLYVRLGTTMCPMCVRAANALMRLCICPGSSELSMLTYKQISLPYLVGMCFK